MYIAIVNYGNESCSLLQWVIESGLSDVTVLSVDTGWAAENWLQRVVQCENYFSQQGLHVVRLQSRLSFHDLITDRQSFPNKKFQWCAGFLKGLPIIEWLDEHDPSCVGTILLATRRSTSRSHYDLPEFIESSDYYQGRRVWHPLYLHESVNKLLEACPIEQLPYKRSLECQPCIHSDRGEIATLSSKDVEKTDQLEKIVGQAMFPTQVFEQQEGIINLRNYLANEATDVLTACYPDMGCGSPWGCGS